MGRWSARPHVPPAPFPMDLSPAPQQLYLDCRPAPAFVTLHRAARAPAREVSVLLCPPFGWDEFCSYRSLRSWAQSLARDGFATLRLSYPGTGDSGGSPRDPDQLEAWTAAVAGAAGWLRGETGAARVTAVGIGLGSALAWLATAGGAAIDDLVLWAPPADGRALVRQLRAFGRMERSQIYRDAEPPGPEAAGDVEAGGFVLSAETVARLEAITPWTAALPDPARRRVLALERDGLAIDAELLAALRAGGATVTVAPGEGFADMTSHPQLARPPVGVITTVGEWLRAGPPAAAPAAEIPAGAAGETPAAPAAEPVLGARESATIAVGAATVRETPVTIERPFGRLSGVLTEPAERPAHGICAILLNPGAGRRIGPNRLWVTAARRWAVLGVPTLRLDVRGIGDADGDETRYRDDAALYEDEFVPDVVAAMDFLRARGTGERFALGGLCSGAFWSLHAALADDRVCALLLVNPRALLWDPGLDPARDLRALLTQRPSPAKILRLATGPRLRSFLRWLLAAPVRVLRRSLAGPPSGDGDARGLDTIVDALVASTIPVTFLFADDEPLYNELARAGYPERLVGAPTVRFERVGVRDHTLRPGWAQREALAILDRAIAGALTDGPVSSSAATALGAAPAGPGAAAPARSPATEPRRQDLAARPIGDSGAIATDGNSSS